MRKSLNKQHVYASAKRIIWIDIIWTQIDESERQRDDDNRNTDYEWQKSNEKKKKHCEAHMCIAVCSV